MSPPTPSYEKSKSEISLQMSHFLLDYLHEIYKSNEGDLALVIVLGEIAHHNMSLHYSKEYGLKEEVNIEMKEGDSFKHKMPLCNAYSLAQSTGIPRETVRRKISRLKELGWIEQSTRGECCITSEVARHFENDFNVKLMEKMLNTSEKIRQILSK